MCDYSLSEVRSRLAQEGERLQVHLFHTGTKGMAPAVASAGSERRSLWQKLTDFFVIEPDHQPVAVCIPPGARLTLHDISISVQRQYGVQSTEEVSFTQLHAEDYSHRDAIRFRNGRTLSLQKLDSGQRVEVLCLTLEEEEEIPAKEEPRVHALGYV